MKRLLLIAVLLFSLKSFSQDTTIKTSVALPKQKIYIGAKIFDDDNLEDIKVGDTALIQSTVYGGRYLETAGITLLNIGADYPKQLLTVVILNDLRSKFSGKPEEIFKGKSVQITGVVTEYKGKRQIVLRSTTDLSINAGRFNDKKKAF